MLLSNTMPELTAQELAFKGMYTVSYFEPKVDRYVSAKYCSWDCFFHHAGIDDVLTQNMVRTYVDEFNSVCLRHPITNKRACIYIRED